MAIGACHCYLTLGKLSLCSFKEGEWGVGSGEWGMGNGEWAMGNGQWVQGAGLTQIYL